MSTSQETEPDLRQRIAMPVVAAAETDLTDGAYRVWLTNLQRNTGAIGVALSLRSDINGWSTISAGGFPKLTLGTEKSAARHGQLTFETFALGRPKIIPPFEARRGDAEANPTEHLLLMAPLEVQGRRRGVVELLLPADSSADRQLEVLTTVGEAGDWIAELEDQEADRRRSMQEATADAVQQFCREIYRHLGLKSAAAAIANEGKRLLGCERLSVVVRRRRHEVSAVSGLDVVEHRSEAAKALAAMATVVGAGQEFVHYPPTDSATDGLRRTCVRP